MRRFGILVLLAAACGPQVIVPEDDGTTGGAPPPGTSSDAGVPGNPATSATTVPATTGSDDAITEGDATFGGVDESTDDGTHFIFTPDGGICGQGLPPGTLAHCECDFWAQDCPAGEKCMPWANDGGLHWNASRCSPIDLNPAQVGDPCTVTGSEVSGVDDCDLGLMCLYVDPETDEGTCVAMCQGSADDPICEDGLTCAIDNDGAITLCLPPCDPLIDDCELGTCIPVQDDFVCFADGTARMPGESCDLPVDCAPGSTCVPSETTGFCGLDASDCCASFCDLTAPDPNATCLPAKTCTPWYRPGTVMPPLDAVGVCLEPR
jgi:hypothetical protein